MKSITAIQSKVVGVIVFIELFEFIAVIVCIEVIACTKEPNNHPYITNRKR